MISKVIGTAMLVVLAATAPITRIYDNTSQDVQYGVCTATRIQDDHLVSIKFNAMSVCKLFEDSNCQSSPVTTLEPIMFKAGAEISKGDNSQLFSSYFICSPGN